jgi:hypothetical protein
VGRLLPRTAGLAALALSACLFGGGAGYESVDDAEVLGFAERVGAFYAALEGRPLNTLLTYEDPELRSYFASSAEFADYYSSLTSQVLASHFKNGYAAAVHVREFRFEGPERAEVDVTLVGKHERALRFWDIEVQRTDAWRRVDGRWVLDPERL